MGKKGRARSPQGYESAGQDARPTDSEGKTQVRCRSGYRGDEYPVGFTCQGEDHEVREVLESGIEEDSETRVRRRVFVVKTNKGLKFKLVQKDDGWYCSKGTTDPHR